MCCLEAPDASGMEMLAITDSFMENLLLHRKPFVATVLLGVQGCGGLLPSRGQLHRDLHFRLTTLVWRGGWRTVLINY